jgi:alanine racemase
MIQDAVEAGIAVLSGIDGQLFEFVHNGDVVSLDPQKLEIRTRIRVDALGRPNRMRVDLDAVQENTRRVCKLIGPSTRVMASLKANAYGHGALEVARAAILGGAQGLATGDPGSAAAIRCDGFDGTILVYAGANIGPAELEVASDAGLALTIQDEVSAERICRAGSRPIDVFIKIDVGHLRLGVEPQQAHILARQITCGGAARLVGVLTHLYDPGTSVDYLQEQLDRFSSAMDGLERNGLLPECRIAASSGPLISHGKLRFDPRLNWVDPGRLLLGIARPSSPEAGVYRPAFTSLKSELIQVKAIEQMPQPGHAPFDVHPGMKIGIVPIGRADGYHAIHPGHALVRGRPAKVLAVWIEHTAIDLTGIEADPGDTVTLYDSQAGSTIAMADALAVHANLRPVDLSLSLGRSVTREYLCARRAETAPGRVIGEAAR